MEQEKAAEPISTFPDFLNSMICIRCFCRYLKSTGNISMTGAKSDRFMVHRQIVSGAADASAAESIRRRKRLH